MIVLDASAAAHYVIGTSQAGEWVEARLVRDPDVHVPHLLDLEVVNALRRLVRQGQLTLPRARTALEHLGELRATRYPHLPLLARIWQLRANLSAYDASYVALAEALDATLVTTDEALARTPGVRLQVAFFSA